MLCYVVCFVFVIMFVSLQFVPLVWVAVELGIQLARECVSLVCFVGLMGLACIWAFLAFA